MHSLSENEFLETCNEPMQQIDPNQTPPMDFWPYFEAIPSQDFTGFDCSTGEVNYIWRDASGKYEHVLFNSQDPNVFMVLVLDLSKNEVHGHRLLNLNKEYDLAP